MNKALANDRNLRWFSSHDYVLVQPIIIRRFQIPPSSLTISGVFTSVLANSYSILEKNVNIHI